MKKFAAALAFVTFSFASAAMAADAAITEGKMLYTVDGKRLGAIYRVKEDGAVQIILNGKMVTVPASSISVANGKIETNLNKPQLLASR